MTTAIEVIPAPANATLLGNKVSRETVFALTPPEHTQSWKPVAYADAVTCLHEEIESQLRLPVVAEQYALNKAGTQMFHVARVDTGTSESGLAIALRQSYDKSIALGVAAGAQVFVCDNLMFDGSAFKIMRKNTTNVWDDFVGMIRAQIATSLDAYTTMQVDVEALKRLKPNQATVAYADWDQPRHDEFAGRNLWGLYNCVTEGLKKGRAGNTIDRHVDAHRWFRGFLPAA
jgi:hypothetical protein